MKKKYELIKGEDWKLEYATWGEGEKSIILFHGFGQSEKNFDELSIAYSSKGYKVYSINLFFHGKSRWNKKHPVSTGSWNEIFQVFLKKNAVQQFEVLAFSMGGKFALALLERFKPTKVILLAPDGIENNIWYRLTTSKYFLRGFFKYAIKKPGIYFGFINLFSGLGFISPRLKRFANSQMETEENRRQVFNSWVKFRDLQLPSTKLFGLLEENNVQVYIGKYDNVVNARRLEKKLAQSNVRCEILNCGHTNLLETYMKHTRR